MCVVEERLSDNLESETGRGLDSHLYRVYDADSGDTLDVDFRHRDLVPDGDE